MKHLSPYIVEQTKRTPKIILKTGSMSVFGRSIPENPGVFYRPVYEWISDYLKNGLSETCVEFGFEYINTSSTKWIYNIIKEIARNKNHAKKIIIHWYYDQGDDDMCELGGILRSMVNCRFFVHETDGTGFSRDGSSKVGTCCM